MEDLSILDVLPLDYFTELVPYLGMQDLFKFSRVCKTFQQMIETFCVFETNENVTTLTLTRTPVVVPPWVDNFRPSCADRNTEDKTFYVKFATHELMFNILFHTEIHCFNFPRICTADTIIEIESDFDENDPTINYDGYSITLHIKHIDSTYDTVEIEPCGNGYKVIIFDEHLEKTRAILPYLPEYLVEMRLWSSYCKKQYPELYSQRPL